MRASHVAALIGAAVAVVSCAGGSNGSTPRIENVKFADMLTSRLATSPVGRGLSPTERIQFPANPTHNALLAQVWHLPTAPTPRIAGTAMKAARGVGVKWFHIRCTANGEVHAQGTTVLVSSVQAVAVDWPAQVDLDTDATGGGVGRVRAPLLQLELAVSRGPRDPHAAATFSSEGCTPPVLALLR